jgi:hypothetical protein
MQVDAVAEVISAEHQPNPEEMASIWFSMICDPGDEFAG